MWAIIGGSGFEKFDNFEVLESLKVETPYGEHSSSLKRVKWKGQEAIFLSRHGENHELLPSEINFRANVFALKKLGAKGVLSFSAIGSLKEELEPEHMVFVNQYIDFTKKREGSFCGNGSVGHYSFAKPVEDDLLNEVKILCQDLDFKTHFGNTYVCVEGPRFSSFAESMMFKSWGADVIGMTNMPEAYLVREAGMIYLPFCFVTDYDCWKAEEDPVSVEMVVKRMKKNYSSAIQVLDIMVKTKLFDQFKVSSINDAIFSGDKVNWIAEP
jgi:5'-methylthioadenosine phosphorylase